MTASDITRAIPGFTLVELILVMALLATVLAFSAPSLSRSLRERYLTQEAARFVALTEYGRDEAISQGVPMVIWIDPKAQRFGLEPQTGYDAPETRRREYALNPDVQLEITKGAKSGNVVRAIEFAPDGLPEPSSIDLVRMVDRFESAISIARTSDGWGYEIVKETK